MIMDSTVAEKTTFPLLGVLGLIFITLKLTGFIVWSWWMVLAPFWVPPALVVIVVWPVFMVWYTIVTKRKEVLEAAEEDQRQQDTLQGFDDTNKH